MCIYKSFCTYLELILYYAALPRFLLSRNVQTRVVKLLLCAYYYYYYYYFIYLNSLLLLLLLLRHIFKQPITITITITRKIKTAYYYYYYYYFPDYYYYYYFSDYYFPILLLPHSIALLLNQTNTTQTDYKGLYYFFVSHTTTEIIAENIRYVHIVPTLGFTIWIVTAIDSIFQF